MDEDYLRLIITIVIAFGKYICFFFLFNLLWFWFDFDFVLWRNTLICSKRPYTSYYSSFMYFYNYFMDIRIIYLFGGYKVDIQLDRSIRSSLYFVLPKFSVSTLSNRNIVSYIYNFKFPDSHIRRVKMKLMFTIYFILYMSEMLFF